MAEVSAGVLLYWQAALDGDAHAIKLLLLGDDDNESEPGVTIDMVDSSGLRLLHVLALAGHAEALASVLADVKADVHMREDRHGQTALHLASVKGHVDVVETLLDHGADPSIVDARGWNCLFAACRAGHDHIVRLLVTRGPPGLVHARGPEGSTPLHRAAYWGRLSTATLLQKLGADSAAVDDAGAEPVDVACKGPGAAVLCLPQMRQTLLSPSNRLEASLHASSRQHASTSALSESSAPPVPLAEGIHTRVPSRPVALSTEESSSA